MTASQKSSEPIRQFCYPVGTYQVLLEPETQAEILPARPICAVPFAPAWCKGMISLRGNLLPVVDMHWLLHGIPCPHPACLLLVHPPQTLAVAVVCDGYPRALTLPPPSQPDTPAASSLPAWISHTVTHAGQTFLAANHTLLFRQIQQTQAQQQATPSLEQ